MNYALELGDFGQTHGLFTESEFDAIAGPLIRTSDLSDRFPNLPGRTGLARLFETLAYAFHPNMKKGVPFAFNGPGNHWGVRRGRAEPTIVNLHCPVLKSGTVNQSKAIPIQERESKS